MNDSGSGGVKMGGGWMYVNKWWRELCRDEMNRKVEVNAN